MRYQKHHTKPWIGLMLAVTVAGIASAQTPIAAQKVEMAVPFGTVPGYLLTVGTSLVFVDQDQVTGSFAIPQQNLRTLRVADGMVTAESKQAVRDRTGERSSFTFRLTDPTMATSLEAWYRGAATDAGPATAPGAAPAKPGAAALPTKMYSAIHDHLLGRCNGTLLIEPERIVYDSITSIDHSRQWQLQDIKELKQDGPYKLEVIPFSGDSYSFRLEGQGMDSSDYRQLVNAITAARVGKDAKE